MIHSLQDTWQIWEGSQDNNSISQNSCHRFRAISTRRRRLRGQLIIICRQISFSQSRRQILTLKIIILRKLSREKDHPLILKTEFYQTKEMGGTTACSQVAVAMSIKRTSDRHSRTTLPRLTRLWTKKIVRQREILSRLNRFTRMRLIGQMRWWLIPNLQVSTVCLISL